MKTPCRIRVHVAGDSESVEKYFGGVFGTVKRATRKTKREKTQRDREGLRDRKKDR